MPRKKNPAYYLKPDMHVPGIVYILQFTSLVGGRAWYYGGWCKRGGLKHRLWNHRRGHKISAVIVRAAQQAGIGFELVFFMTGTRSDERRMKARHGGIGGFLATQRRILAREQEKFRVAERA